MEIQIKDLTKQYSGSKVKALNGVSLVIKPGIFGLVGENGAGKTSLIKILVTMLKKSAGEVYIGEYTLPEDEVAVRGILGYLPQNFDFFGSLTVYEAMDYIAALKNLPAETRKKEIELLLDEVHLLNKSKDKVKQLSGGMKQRLGIAQSLLGNPRVIIMDEPTVGLDPTERLSFRSLLSRFSKDRIIILSSHIISDISMLCSDVAVMKKGQILYSGSTRHLVKNMESKVYTILLGEDEEVPENIRKNIISISRKKDQLEIRFFTDTVPGLKGSISSEPSLEDAYFYLISESGDIDG